jgi:hypothetical protein
VQQAEKQKGVSVIRKLLAGVVAMATFLAVTTVRGHAEDGVTQAIREVMVENLVAADSEDMPRLLATMSREMPNRDLFIRETKQEWAVADTYTRLVDLEVLKHSDAPHANTRLPYATVRVVQTMLKSDRKPGSAEPSEWSRRMLLDQKHPTVEYETLWKREGGKWRMVAGLTAPRPVGD